jgi:hypothetical protein
VLTVFQYSDDDPLGTISYPLFCRIQEWLDHKLETPPSETEIDIWINSFGGSATVAYKIVLELRARCSVVRAVVGDFAKSAATLMMFGMDEIWMGPSSELGPLDVQVEHPDREGHTVSGLDVAKSLGVLNDFAVGFVLANGREVIDFTSLPRDKVFDSLSRLSVGLLEPVLSKLDPQLIHRASQDLDLARHYAVELLHGHANMPRVLAKQIADHFVEHYPAHECLISRSEAERHQLPVRPLGEYPYRQEFEAEFRLFRQEEQFVGPIVAFKKVSDIVDKHQTANNQPPTGPPDETDSTPTEADEESED